MDDESCNLWLHDFRRLEARVGHAFRATYKACELRNCDLGCRNNGTLQEKLSGPNIVYLPLATRDLFCAQDAIVYDLLNLNDVLFKGP
jgi:hypothetical protein